MPPAQPLCTSLLAKIREQIDLTVQLVNRIPEDRMNWTPAVAGTWPVEMLLGHLLDCMAGFCAVLRAAEPQRLAHFSELEKLPVNHACSREEALDGIALYKTRIDEGFALLDDAALGRVLPTIFSSSGETILTLVLGNMEHLINHKHQLFTYLKQMGVQVDSRDLYRFRGVFT